MRKISNLIFLMIALVWSVSIDDLLKEGIALRDAGRYDEAIYKFQQILKSKSRHPQTNFELGKTYLEKNDCDNAIIFLKNALDFGFDKFQGHFTLGQAYEACGNNVEAQLEYSEVVRLKPNDPECLCCQARVSQQSIISESLYQQALKINSKYIPAIVGLANLYANNKQYDKALSYYQMAKTTKPDYSPTYFSTGNFYLQQKMYQKKKLKN